MSTTTDDVLWMLAVMARCGATPVLAGGWGVDALVGRPTRAHRDLDVLVPAGTVDAVVAAFTAAGFVVAVDLLPIRVELSDRSHDRHVDVHPIEEDGRGGWTQHGPGGTTLRCAADALAAGHVGGHAVRCLSERRQREVHSGYPRREQDVHDLALLDALDRGAGR